jgi:hypothetical protein
MPQAKMIWILFGDLVGFDDYRAALTEHYELHRSACGEKGYYLGYSQPQGTSKIGFLNHLRDDATYAIVWHSHGTNERRDSRTGEVLVDRGSIVAADDLTISPAEIGPVSTNLRAIALWGCLVGRNHDWEKKLKLKSENYAFLADPNYIRRPYDYSNQGVSFAKGRGQSTFSGWLENIL